MTKRWPILLLPPFVLLGGCGSKSGTEANAAADAIQADLTPNMQAVEANSAAHVQELIDRALPVVLPDAKSAQYRNVRAGTGGSACGEVSGRTTHAFVPFVVTPAGVGILGTSPKIAFEDPSDFLADAWIRWCATPEELQKVSATIQKAKPDIAGNLTVPIPDVPVGAPPTPVPDAALPKPGPPPPPPQIGSFFNSVQHRQ